MYCTYVYIIYNFICLCVLYIFICSTCVAYAFSLKEDVSPLVQELVIVISQHVGAKKQIEVLRATSDMNCFFIPHQIIFKFYCILYFLQIYLLRKLNI